MDWSGLYIPFSITDIIGGALQTFSSFAPLVWLVVGLTFGGLSIAVILALFRGESIWDVFR